MDDQEIVRAFVRDTKNIINENHQLYVQFRRNEMKEYRALKQKERKFYLRMTMVISVMQIMLYGGTTYANHFLPYDKSLQTHFHLLLLTLIFFLGLLCYQLSMLIRRKMDNTHPTKKPLP